jgi:hypothetical protein
MCRRVECSTCGRPTYAGCGAHIEQVLGDVAVADRCHCREKASSTSVEERTTGSLSRLRALFGRALTKGAGS